MGKCSCSLVFMTILWALPLVTMTLLSGAIAQVKGVALNGLPLNTNSRWIVNQDAKRVKLAPS